MKRIAVNILTGLVFLTPVVFLGAGAGWAYDAYQAAEQQAIETPSVTISEPAEAEQVVKRYETVEVYFKATNPKLLSHRFGEPLFSRDV